MLAIVGGFDGTPSIDSLFETASRLDFLALVAALLAPVAHGDAQRDPQRNQVQATVVLTPPGAPIPPTVTTTQVVAPPPPPPVAQPSARARGAAAALRRR